MYILVYEKDNMKKIFTKGFNRNSHSVYDKVFYPENYKLMIKRISILNQYDLHFLIYNLYNKILFEVNNSRLGYNKKYTLNRFIYENKIKDLSNFKIYSIVDGKIDYDSCNKNYISFIKINNNKIKYNGIINRLTYSRLYKLLKTQKDEKVLISVITSGPNYHINPSLDNTIRSLGIRGIKTNIPFARSGIIVADNYDVVANFKLVCPYEIVYYQIKELKDSILWVE